MKNKFTGITGIGSALVDMLVHEEDQFLKDIGKKKGGMTLVDENSDIENILQRSSAKHIIVPGGAACNTIVGVGQLGGKARFIGTRGNDNYGNFFETQLKKYNVEPVLNISPLSTGKVVSVITPDAQRSMFTFLGASTQLDPAKISGDMFKDTAIAVIEGYLLFNPELIMAALKSAKSQNVMIALDLASFEVVENSRDILQNIIKDYVDILIANEDEAKAFTGFADEAKALKFLSKDVSIGVLKLGKRGSCISAEGSTIKVKPASGGDVIDTTGAGDLWAAGFLFGLAHGFSIEKSGQIASACGYEVCRVVGAHIPDNGWNRIKALI